MADLSAQSPADGLLKGPEKAANPGESMIADVAKDFGVHPLRQMKDILTMRIGSQKLGSSEYYDLRVFDPIHDKKAKRQFLGQGGINALNMAINPDTLMETKNFIGNKLAYAQHLKAAGIKTPETQAFVTSEIKSKQDTVLNDAIEIAAFLRERAVYPLFGKPLGGSLSVGSVRIDRIDRDALHLARGKPVSVEQFAAALLRDYADGYLLQTALVPHPSIARITGDVIGSVRIVTAHDGRAAKPAYGVWKIPGPGAVSDNFWQDGSMLALIDLADGTVINCHRGKGPQAEFLQTHPKSQEQIVGFHMPFWQEALSNACAAHDLFPDLGICGFDVAITEDGPIILECNDRPNHMIYQFPARRGVLNPDLKHIWDALVARRKNPV